ncbi:hypothetical protein C7B69_04710 [filamentous cyanobacterium Phorm 46]|nr:hypothetical protein C7B69_04710 [filamentous cyanobacterium Phorm 46]PSB51437.1 hypothetical protein C7B67_10855 [filamentous cyanobacterium Phorm 6]
MTDRKSDLKITWEKMPEPFILEERPAANIDQPLLAAALREILEIAGLMLEGILVAPNMGICATMDSKTVMKAPDLFYASNVQPLPAPEVRRIYSPNLEVKEEIPAIVMEFLGATEGDEYSAKPTFPPGKFFFYERILRVPVYAIFKPLIGLLHVYKLNPSGYYEWQKPEANGHYWIEGVGLFLGIWQGTKAERTGYWLRWWDESGQMLLWGAEMVEKERQRADRLSAQLRAAGIEPEA